MKVIAASRKKNLTVKEIVQSSTMGKVENRKQAAGLYLWFNETETEESWI
jgi:hypothetical protein